MDKQLATTTEARATLAFATHDHGRCVQQALSQARAACAERGARLTQLRQPGPPTVYRALEFLREQGFVHRVESLNAYVGCQIGAGPHDHQLYICRGCGATLESAQPAIRAAVAHYGEEVGFAVESMALEVIGLCPACAGGEHA